MSKTILAGAVVASVVLWLPIAANADSGHGEMKYDASEEGHHGAHGASKVQPASIEDAWAALIIWFRALSRLSGS